MWKFKPFAQKEPTGLEGRFFDVGDIKVHVKNVIAEGGFSCVYLAKDASNASKQYALKHIICNDQESMDLVMKEIKVMKSLKGHPNVVTLYSHTILDMGRTKEALLVMECCEKSLVNVLESRGTGYFEEKQIMAIFRDVCNAVFAMHCHSPPIAHRDLKAENLLLGLDGLWKLCDFGSTSTNHKRFEKPEEMGIEEDNIRKHTTPAYRAPEMWDLYRRDLISEKVDIWALGCLLYRICYFKSAFDGESKLQIWFRVNEQLPVGSQKSLPDRPPHMRETASDITEGISKIMSRTPNPVPRRSPPPVPSSSEATNLSTSNTTRGGLVGGAFWSTEHAKDTLVPEERGEPKFDDEKPSQKEDRSRSEKYNLHGKASPSGRENSQANPMKSSSASTFENEAFNSFVADFDTSKLSPTGNDTKSKKDNSLEAEINRLQEQLKQANAEKAEITSKYEKLTAICRSQRQELQELKQALASRTPSPKMESTRNQPSSSSKVATSQRAKNEGTVLELQQGLLDKNSTTPELKSWQAFSPSPTSQADSSKSVRTRNGHSSKQGASTGSTQDGWGFENESFTAVPAASSRITRSGEGNTSLRFGDSNKLASKNTASQPAGWAGF
uniref:non-specific serine/threonine protein kinase n=1 Tax=Chenopodium quinoa TaxID=63459 RepID=A0A803L8T3_CHEQI